MIVISQIVNFIGGYWCIGVLVIGYWLLVIGYWLLVIGYWLLVIGYWLLVIGVLVTCYWCFGYLLFVYLPKIHFCTLNQ
jgi:hypothetical protein